MENKTTDESLLTTNRSTVRLRKEKNMSRIAEIQQAILALPKTDYLQLRQWFGELDWENWDRRIEVDSKNGKLDFLIAEAFEAKEKGNLKDL